MTSIVSRAAAACALTLLCAAAPAMAEPVRTVTMSPSSPTVTWESTGQGFATLAEVDDLLGCVPFLNECEDSLLKVEGSPLSVLFTTKGDGSATLVDADISIYNSDASGAEGTFIKESAGGTPEENLAADLDPGNYLVRVSWATGSGTVTVEGKIDGEIPAGAAPGGGSTPPAGTPAANKTPDSAIALKARTAKKGKLKRFSGTASDDAGIAKVEFGLLQAGKKGKCKQLTSSGKFATAPKCAQPSVFLPATGTTKWAYLLKKGLPKGKYTAFSRATDSAGAVEAGFGSKNKRKITVK
jgi:hypothetical protein